MCIKKLANHGFYPLPQISFNKDTTLFSCALAFARHPKCERNAATPETTQYSQITLVTFGSLLRTGEIQERGAVDVSFLGVSELVAS